MSDLETQLRRYLEDTPPVTFEEITASTPMEPEVGTVSPQRAGMRRGSLIAVTAAIATLVVGILIVLPYRDDPTSRPDTAGRGSTPPTMVDAPAAADEATARNSGQPYDPAMHDLCVWFSPQEIDTIVTTAYLDHGAEPPTGTFTTDDNGLGGVGCTWFTEADGVRLSGTEFSLLAMEFQRAEDLVLIPYTSRETGTPLDEPDEFTPYGWDGRARIGNLSRGVWGYIQGIHASFTIDGHIEVVEFLHWAPHHLTERDGPINPIGLDIADEMLRRIGWVDGERTTDGGAS